MHLLVSLTKDLAELIITKGLMLRNYHYSLACYPSKKKVKNSQLCWYYMLSILVSMLLNHEIHKNVVQHSLKYTYELSRMCLWHSNLYHQLQEGLEVGIQRKKDASHHPSEAGLLLPQLLLEPPRTRAANTHRYTTSLASVT